MRYFITGITGAVVPFILEELFAKDDNPFFYLAIRRDAKGSGIEDRFEAVLHDSDLSASGK